MKYKKKPVVVEAEQFFPEVKPYPEGVILRHDGKYWIETLEGNFMVSPGDFIITGVKGERYPCKPDIFNMTYEPVPEHCSHPVVDDNYPSDCQALSADEILERLRRDDPLLCGVLRRVFKCTCKELTDDKEDDHG